MSKTPSGPEALRGPLRPQHLHREGGAVSRPTAGIVTYLPGDFFSAYPRRDRLALGARARDLASFR
jgi:hypothetical protein